jgi:hypothetical protein
LIQIAIPEVKLQAKSNHFLVAISMDSPSSSISSIFCWNFRGSLQSQSHHLSYKISEAAFKLNPITFVAKIQRQPSRSI